MIEQGDEGDGALPPRKRPRAELGVNGAGPPAGSVYVPDGISA